MMGAGSRLERLKLGRVPTLVFHGSEDVLVPIENGRLVAGAVPGARFLEVQGMGHDIPERAWSELADAIEVLARRSAPARRQWSRCPPLSSPPPARSTGAAARSPASRAP